MGDRLESVERNLDSLLSRFGNSVEIDQFRRTYLHLVLMFKDELESAQINGAVELRKCLAGEKYNKSLLDDLEKSCFKQVNDDLRNNVSMTRKALLNRLFLGALLDTEKTDFFYVTDPIFLFAKEMRVVASDLEEILASEFPQLDRI